MPKWIKFIVVLVTMLGAIATVMFGAGLLLEEVLTPGTMTDMTAVFIGVALGVGSVNAACAWYSSWTGDRR